MSESKSLIKALFFVDAAQIHEGIGFSGSSSKDFSVAAEPDQGCRDLCRCCPGLSGRQ